MNKLNLCEKCSGPVLPSCGDHEHSHCSSYPFCGDDYDKLYFIKPIRDNAVVQLFDYKEQVNRGLLLNDGKMTHKEGVIVYVNDKLNELEVGQTVILPLECGYTITRNNIEYCFIHPGNILGIIYNDYEVSVLKDDYTTWVCIQNIMLRQNYKKILSDEGIE